MRIQSAVAGAGLLVAMTAAPVAGYTMAQIVPPPEVSVLIQTVDPPNSVPAHQPGYGDFGSAGNAYGSDGFPTSVYAGGGAFSDQQPLNANL